MGTSRPIWFRNGPIQILAATAWFLPTFSAAYAQPTLTVENTITPFIGRMLIVTHFSASNLDELSEGMSQVGEEVTWDISEASFDHSGSLRIGYVKPPFADIPGADTAEFQSANLVQILYKDEDPQGSDSISVASYTFYDRDRLLNLGFASFEESHEDGSYEESLFKFDPAELHQSFPIVVGSEWTSESAYDFGGQDPNSGTSISVTKTLKVIGSGTLVTAHGSSEVLQIEEISVTSLSGSAQPAERSVQLVGPALSSSGSGSSAAVVMISALVSFDAEGDVSGVSYSVSETISD